LTNSAAVDLDAELSSRGRLIFRSNRSGVNELWIANADGSRPWQATRSRGPFVGDPHWSPDGRDVVFTSHADGNPDIYVMRCEPDAVTCSEQRQLTRTPASDAVPTWSADGRWIYFSSSRSGDYEVWRMAADGGGTPERITCTRELFYYPPVERSEMRFPPVRAVDVKTGQVRDIAVGDIRLGRGLSLSPDGRWLLRSQIDHALTLVMVAE
jgi:dipeptidyl aminopeptidase/acylaminoacyl peptidase